MSRCILPICVCFVLAASMGIVSRPVLAQSPQGTLSQYVSTLQSSPNDVALREQIIRHVQTMNPAPAIPETAREHFIMALTFVEKAKDPSGYERAIKEYELALTAAPWWADAYKKLAIAQKAAARYDEAAASLKLYIISQPADARDAQDEIYKLKALKQATEEDRLKREREENERAAAEAAHRAAEEERARLQSIEGTWCQFFWGACHPESAGLMKIQRQGIGGWVVNFPDWKEMNAYDIRQSGQKISFARMIRGADPELNTDYLDLSLSADGQRLQGSVRSLSVDGNRPHWVSDQVEYVRQ